MIGARHLRFRVSAPLREAKKPQGTNSGSKRLSSFSRPASISTVALRRSRVVHIRTYCKDTVSVPSRSIEGFGGPTDQWHYKDDVEAACRKGILLKDAQDYQGALAEFSKAIRLSDETSYRAYSLRGDLNQTLGNLEDALYDYSRVLKYIPTHVPTLTSHASVYKRMGDYEKAKSQFDFILTFEGMYAPAWLGKAECHAQMGEHDLAVEAFRKALEFKDRWVPAASVYEALGDSLVMTNKVEEALVAYQTSLSLDSRQARCWGAFGVTLYVARKFPEATDAFTQALALGNETGGISRSELLAKRASCYLHFRNLDKALADCNQALTEYPDFYKARLVRAQCYHTLERLSDAIEDYSVFLAASDKNFNDSARESAEVMGQHWQQLADVHVKRAECYIELWGIEVTNSKRLDPKEVLQQIKHEVRSHSQTIAIFEEVNAALKIIGDSAEATLLRHAFDDLVAARRLNMTQAEVPLLIDIIREILNFKPSSSNSNAKTSNPKVVTSTKQL